MRNAAILSSGVSLPDRVIPNSYFNELLGEDVDTWLRERLNIYERRWCEDDQSTIDLCEGAAIQAMERAGLAPSDIDLIVVATDTPEYLSPPTGAVLQYRLRADRAGAFDLNSACAGFVTAMDVAARYIRADERYNYVLVVGVGLMSRYLDRTDKRTVDIFSDGAGAIVLGAIEPNGRGYLDSELITLGQYHDGMGIYGGGTKNPASERTLAEGLLNLRINYRFPPELNPQLWSHITRSICQRKGLEPADFQHFILTQLNINSIRETMQRLELPFERAHTSMAHFGYPGAACIPITYDLAQVTGKFHSGDRVIMIGSGSGLSFAGVAFQLL